MEQRKQKEIEHYEERAKKRLAIKADGNDFEGFRPFLLGSYKFLYNFLKDKCKGKNILDYGCGDGIHSTWLAKRANKLMGIDLSENSLQIAKERAKIKGVDDKAEFLLMDCENLKFADRYFDIIFDGGTFSSLDLKKAFPELARVLKSDGFLIGIETLGHNPFTNLKRMVNKAVGKRTKWAAGHIVKMDDFKKAEEYFGEIETYFFHSVSWIGFPFLNLPGGKLLLKTLEKLDKCLPFLNKYSFKVVFIFSKPKNV